MQVLTALELGRQARIAANRAYLAGLQLGPGAMSLGQVRPLQVADPMVLTAARQLATTAALTQAKSQVCLADIVQVWGKMWRQFIASVCM